jgi:hypothetical protein
MTGLSTAGWVRPAPRSKTWLENECAAIEADYAAGDAPPTLPDLDFVYPVAEQVGIDIEDVMRAVSWSLRAGEPVDEHRIRDLCQYVHVEIPAIAAGNCPHRAAGASRTTGRKAEGTP